MNIRLSTRSFLLSLIHKDATERLNRVLSPTTKHQNKEPERLTTETIISSLLGITHTSTFHSGNAALLTLFKAMEIPRSSQLIVPAICPEHFCRAADNLSLELVPVDVTPNWTMNYLTLADKVTKKTSAIYLPHLFGAVANVGKIADIARNAKIPLIEDCTHCLGITNQAAFSVGTAGIASIVSFPIARSTQSIESGATISTNSSNLSHRIHDIARQDAASMPNETASILNSNLNLLPTIIIMQNSRQDILSLVQKFEHLSQSRTMPHSNDRLILSIPDNSKLIETLSSHGIETERPAIASQDKFSSEIRPTSFPVASKLIDSLVEIPANCHLPKNALDFIASELSGFLDSPN